MHDAGGWSDALTWPSLGELGKFALLEGLVAFEVENRVRNAETQKGGGGSCAKESTALQTAFLMVWCIGDIIKDSRPMESSGVLWQRWAWRQELSVNSMMGSL